MNLRVAMGLWMVSASVTGVAQAQELTPTLLWDSYSVLGGTTVSATVELPAGFAPVNDDVAFVYDPNFHFYMRGYNLDPLYDRRDEFRDYGYVLVAAAGDPGGNYPTFPSWLSHEDFSATYTDGQVDLSYTYNATIVPTRRGYQVFLIYANLTAVDPAASLFVYDDDLTFGPGNYLVTGDGPEQATVLLLQGDDAYSGEHAIEVRSEGDTPGTHWKLMLFANGNAAGYDGVDLSAYGKLVFWAKASRDLTLQGGFGTADDSGFVGFAPLALTTEYQRFEIDLSSLDRSDINTPFWVYLHKALNPFSFEGVSVYLDAIELVAAP